MLKTAPVVDFETGYRSAGVPDEYSKTAVTENTAFGNEVGQFIVVVAPDAELNEPHCRIKPLGNFVKPFAVF